MQPTILGDFVDDLSRSREPGGVRGEARRPGLAPPSRARWRPCALDTPAERRRAERPVAHHADLPNPSGPLRASLQLRDRTAPPASRWRWRVRLLRPAMRRPRSS